MTITISKRATKPSALILYLEAGGDHIYTTVDQDSNSGTNVLYCASTTGMEVGMRLNVDPTGAGGGQEYVDIASIDSGVSVTLEANLVNTHTSAGADPVTITWNYVTQTRNSNTSYVYSSLQTLSPFSDESSITITSANKTVIIFGDPTEDATNGAFWAVGRSWEPGNYSIRDTQCWFYGTGALNQGAKAGIATTTVDADSSGTTLNVASTTGFAANDYILIDAGGGKEEMSRISSITAGVSFTLDRTLASTHLGADAATVWEFMGADDFNNT